MDLPIFIDVEASGFGRGSYPIEVGVALKDGSTHCMIVRPDDEWQHWDDGAENLHGIKRSVLVEHGHDIEEVAHVLNNLLQDQIVYSDAWGNDSSWLALLYDKAGFFPRYKIESLRRILDEEHLVSWALEKARVIVEMDIPRHRASSDARVLQETYRRICC